MPKDYGILPGDYTVELFAESDLVDAEAVLRFWEQEVGMPADEGRRRLEELRFVALMGEELVAVSTAYLEWSKRLGANFWRYRTFVTEAHRETGLAGVLAIRAHEYSQARFASGDTRAIGIMLEVENEILKRAMNTAVWGPPHYTFIGENERGDHLRVHYYPGALVPPRPS